MTRLAPLVLTLCMTITAACTPVGPSHSTQLAHPVAGGADPSSLPTHQERRAAYSGPRYGRR